MKKRHLIGLILIFTNHFIIGQTTINDFYPKLQDIRLADEASELKPLFKISGCLSGDCQNGKGVWLALDHIKSGSSKTNAKSKLGYYSFRNAEVVLNIYEGVFSENGGRITGKHYSTFLIYEQKDRSKLLKTVDKYVVDDLLKDQENLCFEGDFILASDKLVYARSKGFDRLSERSKAEYKSVYSWFSEGEEQLTAITYSNNSGSVKKQTGIRNQFDHFVLGKIEYENGDEYLGFLNDGKKYGTGIFTQKGQKPQSGMWVNDSILYTLDMITFPLSTYDSWVSNDLITTEIVVDDKKIAGNMHRDPSTGRVFFISNDKNIYYHGFLKDQKVNDVGFYMNLLVEPTTKYATYDGSKERLVVGLFENGSFVDGTRLDHEWKNPSTSGHSLSLHKIHLYSGTFLNRRLHGCGTYTYLYEPQPTVINQWTKYPRYTYLQGEFINGKITGWHFKIERGTTSIYEDDYEGYFNALYIKDPRANRSISLLDLQMFDTLMKTTASNCEYGNPPPNVQEYVSGLKEKRINDIAARVAREDKEREAGREKWQAKVATYKNVRDISGKQIYHNYTTKEFVYADYERNVVIVFVTNLPAHYEEISFNDVGNCKIMGDAKAVTLCDECDGKGHKLVPEYNSYSQNEQGGSYNIGNTTYTPVYKKTTTSIQMRPVTCKKCKNLGYIDK